MDRYKKKSLKFSGFARELRTVEINSSRAQARDRRFSIMRPLDETLASQEEKNRNVSKIPTVGQTQSHMGSRLEMLRKWKQEKVMKQQQEQRLKKPTFKVGVVKPTPPPVFVNKKIAFDKTSSRLGISKMQASHVLPTLNKGTTVAGSQTKLKPKDLTVHSSTSKMQFMPKPKDSSRAGLLKVPNKESHLQASGNKTQSVSTTKPKETMKTNLLKVPNKESHLQASGNKTQSVSTTKPKDKMKTYLLKGPNKIAYSGLPKSTVPKIPSKKPTQMPQTSIPKTNMGDIKHTAPRIPDIKCTIPRKPDAKCAMPIVPDTKYRHKPLFGKSKVVNNIPASISSRSQGNITTRSNKDEENTDKNLTKENDMPTKQNCIKSCENEENVDKNSIKKNGIPTKQNCDVPIKSNETEEEVKENSIKENGISLEQDSKNVTFQCDLSFIQPTEEIRKSFAPKNFVFCPPSELNSSLFTDDGPWSIFTKLKAEMGRTSTPKEKSSLLRTSSEARTSLDVISPGSDVEQQEDVQKDLNQSNSFIQPSKVNDLTEKDAESENEKPAFGSIHEGSELKVATPELDLEKLSVEKSENEKPAFGSIHEGSELKEATVATPELDLEKLSVEKSENEKPAFGSIHEGPELKEAAVATPELDLEKLSLEKDFPVRRSLRLVNFPSDFDKRPCSYRRSEKPALASINEQVEAADATPKSGRKKTNLNKDFTPRRSTRLAKQSEVENLLEMRRPTLFGTPENDEVFTSTSHLPYDFDRLHLETESVGSEKDISTFESVRGKVSLLYTPPRKGKASVSRKASIKGDLISFSPSV